MHYLIVFERGREREREGDSRRLGGLMTTEPILLPLGLGFKEGSLPLAPALSSPLPLPLPPPLDLKLILDSGLDTGFDIDLDSDLNPAFAITLALALARDLDCDRV
ncbi:hypothetical protein MGN70_002191 [Eutypa lata]|nr:hypothetical protein MGN70_002191 [Eutypa lata]